MTNQSGEHTVPVTISKGYDLLVKILVPILTLLCTTTATLLWSHEGRLTVLEVRSERIVDDVAEIKTDVKKLLEGPR